MTSCPRCQRTYEDGVRFCPVDGALVTAEVQDPNLGRVLMGQFELREVAGRGAMGTVYRAYQRTMDRIVAVKLLRPDIVKEPGVLRRFLREARAAARLQHPNIVTVHLVGETDDGVPYFVMEHIDGVSLEAICEAQGPQPLPRTLWFGRQIASALSEAHNLGIVHRDLKPANILVTDRSRVPDLVKVLDFGIAKIVHGDAPDQSLLTADGTIFGTPHYIAPEQASGGDIDHRVDVYSLGVLLFRLTTGALPFEGNQSMQVVLRHLREEPPRPRTLEPSIPPAMEELILACLAKNRARRPDAEAIIAELDRLDAAMTGAMRAIKGGMRRATGPMAAVPPPEPLRPAAQSGSLRAVSAAASSPVAASRSPMWAQPTEVGGAVARHVTGIIPTARGRAASPWASSAVWLGVLAAVCVGATVGVLAALTHNQLEDHLLPPAPARSATSRSARTRFGSDSRGDEAANGMASSSGNGIAAVPAANPPATPAPAPPVASASATAAAPGNAAAAPAPIVGAAAVPEVRVTTSPAPTHGLVADAARRRARKRAGDDMPVTIIPADPPSAVARPLPSGTPSGPGPVVVAPGVTPSTPSPPPAAIPSPSPAAPSPSSPSASPVAPPSSATPPPPPPPSSAAPAPSSPAKRPADEEPPPAAPPTTSDPTTVQIPPAN